MNTISLCMIVKDEEKVLERALINARIYADEIIIVDTGSTDSTKQIASKYTDKIYDFDWCDDFSKARNFAFQQATCDYLMWLDADDIVPDKTANYICTLKQDMTSDVYMLKYESNFRKNGEATFSYFRERIIRNCKNAKWEGCVHECITPFGKVERVNFGIEHHSIKTSISRRNLDIYLKQSKIRALNPREMYYFGRELYDHKKYRLCIKTLKQFVQSNKGWLENNIDACFLISLCYLQLNNPDKQLEYLLKTFYYDTPRANICYFIGNYFFDKNNYDMSIYWYKLSLSCKDVTEKGGFVQKDYYGYLPHIQLCVTYFKLNNIKDSYLHNEKAGEFYNSETVQNNRKYFETNYKEIIAQLKDNSNNKIL